MPITDVRARVGDLYDRLPHRRLYDEAASQGLTLSAFLEQEDPSEVEERLRGEDAFTRLMAVAGIVTRSDPAVGYYASMMEEFTRDDRTKGLFPEWANRVWRSSQFGALDTRAQAQYLSSDLALGQVLRPYADDPTLREKQVQPAIPLSEVIALTTPIDSTDYRASYLVEPSADDVRMFRVGESAEIPRARLRTSQRAKALVKFGRAIEASYEALRRQRVDMVAAWIRRVALQAQADQVAAALDAAINGDGNASTSATVYNLTTLDPAATVGTLTARAWIRFRSQFKNPYALRAAFARELTATDLQLLNIGTANTLLATVGLPGINTDVVPINQALSGGIRLGITDDVAASTILGMDTNWAIQRVVEAGSQISEAERWIERQVELLTLTENETYMVWDANASKVLNLAA